MKENPVFLLFISFWVILFSLLLYAFYQRHLDEQGGIEQVLSLKTKKILVLRAGKDHHFRLKGKINNLNVRFMVDTGASKVSVPFDIASQSGLKKQYPIRVKTANGVTNAFLTRINTLVLGNIELHNISAVIMTQSHGDVLLGMSALKTLEMKQEEGTLRLIKKPTP